jgi:serine/threonine protein kinase
MQILLKLCLKIGQPVAPVLPHTVWATGAFAPVAPAPLSVHLCQAAECGKCTLEKLFVQLPCTLGVKLTQHRIFNQLLHNDVKCDNVMIYKYLEGSKPVFLDFGKACKIGNGKAKNLTQAEKKKYRERHSHIAPEIVEETSPQTASSYIFALGRII